jgi:hypothetical protein
MKKPNILICGPSQYTNTDLLCAATPAGTIPENTDNDDFIPGSEGNDGPDETEKKLVRRFVETPVANFIEANEITDLGKDGCFPENLSMHGYVKEIEQELRTDGILSEKNAKIDAVWYCPCVTSFMDESEKDFIRSAAGLPGALIVTEALHNSTRAEFKRDIDVLTALAGSRRLILAPTASSGMNFMSMSSGTWHLVEKTKRMFLDGTGASDEERAAYETAWTRFYEKKIDDWREALDEALDDCIGQAARRAAFLLDKPTELNMNDLIEEGVGLLGELVGILRGGAEFEARPRKATLAHAAELRENIELMIYEVAACFGRAADSDLVELILRHSKTSGLPKDAAAVTYAAGQVAKAVSEPWTEYTRKEVLAIYREAKEEAMEMEFKPFDDDNPYADLEDVCEVDEEDLEDSGDEQDGLDAESDGGPGDDVHEPADELPDDCVASDEPEWKD